ncbi:hypothetical protein [Niabella aurantiaca]|uniref:hypothetical protein n=1 Tax=Niabella aurantiaca TaxID=379900 RepID=UPI00037034FE|nr:hypothetical protein [Niabella aurantiaca]
MGQGALLRIYNATTSTLKETNREKPYQMTRFDPPGAIRPGTAAQFYIEFSEKFLQYPADDKGKIWYGFQGTPLSMLIEASGSMGDKHEFAVAASFSWPDPTKWSPKYNLPYYICYIRTQAFYPGGDTEKWDFFGTERQLFARHISNGKDGKYQAYAFKILELAHFCDSNMEATEVADAIAGKHTDAPVYQKFIKTVNDQLSHYPVV